MLASRLGASLWSPQQSRDSDTAVMRTAHPPLGHTSQPSTFGSRARVPLSPQLSRIRESPAFPIPPSPSRPAVPSAQQLLSEERAKIPSQRVGFPSARLHLPPLSHSPPGSALRLGAALIPSLHGGGRNTVLKGPLRNTPEAELRPKNTSVGYSVTSGDLIYVIGGLRFGTVSLEDAETWAALSPEHAPAPPSPSLLISR